MEEYKWDLPRSRSDVQLSRPLVAKVPMKNTVIDSENKIFKYEFRNGKVIYRYLGITVPIKTEKYESKN